MKHAHMFTRGRRGLLGLGAVIGVVVSLMAAGLASGATATAENPSAHAAKKYSVILINNFMGNTWRPVMMQTAQALSEAPPLQKRVSSMRLVVSDNNATSENAAINAAILAKPDILLIDAANSTASNQQIQRACDAGITVVSFDVLVTAPCAWKIAVNFRAQGIGQAQYVVNAMHRKGTVLLDLGMQGAKSVDDWLSGVKSVLKKYPNVKVKTYYGQFSPGGETAGVAGLIPSTPEIDGLITHDYGAYGLKALRRAGRKPVPTAGFAYNVSLKTCLAYKVPCVFYSSPTWVSGSALKLAIQVRDGQLKGDPRQTILKAPWFVSDHSIKFPAHGYPVLDVKKSVLPKVNGGIMLPLSPLWAKLTPAEVLKKPKING